jgi:hypothetical protein
MARPGHWARRPRPPPLPSCAVEVHLTHGSCPTRAWFERRCPFGTRRLDPPATEAWVRSPRYTLGGHLVAGGLSPRGAAGRWRCVARPGHRRPPPRATTRHHRPSHSTESRWWSERHRRRSASLDRGIRHPHPGAATVEHRTPGRSALPTASLVDRRRRPLMRSRTVTGLALLVAARRSVEVDRRVQACPRFGRPTTSR